MTRPINSEDVKNDSLLSRRASATEVALAKIWTEVLRLPDVAVDANFFDIGGDSMKAMEVIVRASETLRIALPLMAFFEDPTIAHLAAVSDELMGGTTAAPIVRVPGRRKFPLSYAQQVFWLLEQQNAGTGLYNTARIFRLHGNVDAALLERSLNELRRRHEILQVRFVHEAGGPVQIVDLGAPLILAVADLSTLDAATSAQNANALALETVRQPFDLELGPVLRARLVRLTDNDSLLCIAIHHVVSDGFTGSILLDDLSAIYDAFADARPSPLPELDLHFTDFAAWEQESLDGPQIEHDLEYWTSVLRNSHIGQPASRFRAALRDQSAWTSPVNHNAGRVAATYTGNGRVERCDPLHGSDGRVSDASLSLVRSSRFHYWHDREQSQPERNRTDDRLFRQSPSTP